MRFVLSNRGVVGRATYQSAFIRLFAVLTVLSRLGVADAASRDCDPKMDCTPSKQCVQKTDDRNCAVVAQLPECVLKTDTRDCEPKWGCEQCAWFDVGCLGSRAACEANKVAYRAGCEQSKAAQNAVYAAEFSACRADREKQLSPDQIERRRVECQEAQAAQNKLYASELTKCQTELDLERQQCERTRTRLREACEAGLRGPFSCDVAGTMALLSRSKLPFVDETQQRVAALTGEASPTQRWMDTACTARGRGVPYRNAVLSSDGFWTIDLALQSFSIGDVAKPSGERFIRLIIRPPTWGGGKAHEVANSHYITTQDTVVFGGALVVDRVPASSLEVHVVDDFEIVIKDGPRPQ
jgi:hypothetical protein